MESSAPLELAKHALLMFGIILAAGTLSDLIARLARIPDVVVFLLVCMKAPGAQVIASVTFITILIQATTTKWLAKKLGLLVEPYADKAAQSPISTL